MNGFVRGMAWLVAITCLVWVAVLWRWQGSGHDITVHDIVRDLVALPLMLVALVLVGRWAWRGLQAKAAERREAAGAANPGMVGTQAARPGEGGAGTHPSEADAAQRHAAFPVWWAAMNTPAGSTATETLQAAQALDPRPAPDAQCLGPDGLPVMCARIRDLDTQALLQDLPEALPRAWAQLGEAPPAPTVLDEAVVRAWAALQPVLDEAAQALALWQACWAPQRPSTTPPLGPPSGGSSHPVTVRVMLGCPESWPALAQQVVGDAVLSTLQASTEQRPAPLEFTSLTTGGEHLWHQADQWLAQMHQLQRPGLLLVLAAHSDLSDTAIERLDQAGRLFNANHHPRGLMPGEAAAGLLLSCTHGPMPPSASPSTGAPPDEQHPLAWVHRPALAQRDKSIEQAGKVSSEALQATVAHAITASRLAATAATGLICDANQHTPRGTELFATTLALLPHLDPNDEMRLLGAVCGGAGVATPLCVIAAACQQAQTQEAPVIATCLGDPLMRLSIVARPFSPDSAAPDQVTPDSNNRPLPPAS